MRLYMGLMTCKDMVSLTDLAKQYSEESPGYVIQTWMRSRNTTVSAETKLKVARIINEQRVFLSLRPVFFNWIQMEGFK